jgi:beta-dihydromenaquinone-9 omega-hydroxylase
MTATQSGAEAAQGWVPRGGCPFERGTSYPAPATQDATALIGKLASRRMSSRAGFPVIATMRRDARIARMYGPLLAKALALNVARKARSRLVGNHDPKHVQITDFDPFDPAIARDPYPHYRELLAGERVQYNPKRDVYILSRYADVREAARNHDALSSARGVTLSRGWLPFLPTSDPPAHTRMRKQLAPGLARGALEFWRPMVDQLARESVGGLLTQTPVDVVSTVAAPMPMRTITNVLGVAGPDEAAFYRLSNQAVRITDVNLSVSGLGSLVQGFTGSRRLCALFTHRRDNGLLGECTVLGQLAAHAEHGRLSDDELFFFAVLLLVAGYESTANMISTLFLTLADYPDQLRLLAQRPDLIPSAIEEQLRFVSPIQNICRTARVDYPVGQAVIPAGSLVLLAWGAANRDPRQYDHPDVFRADRNPTGHLAFGSGIHSCPGTQLARMEGQAVLREIVTNIDRIEVVEPPAWTTNANLRGLTRLRVAVTPRATAQSLSHVR